MLNAGTTDPEKGTGSPLGRDADTFAPGAIRGRDTDTSVQTLNKALGDWFMSTDIGKGYASGNWKCPEIGLEARNLFCTE